MIDVGMQVPALQFKATHGNTSFESFRGQWVVLYFYPRDATPGCTMESIDFRDLEKAFSLLNATIVGVSRDTLSSHKRFKEKQSLPFELISDPEEMLCGLFDVMKPKMMYGKECRGIERSTFLIDPKGIVRYVWRKVDVKNHAEAVLTELKRLAG